MVLLYATALQPAEKLGIRIRASLYRLRKKSPILSTTMEERPFRELTFAVTGWLGAPKNPAPQGQANLAQRFSAGKTGKIDASPGGTTQFSHRLFTAA